MSSQTRREYLRQYQLNWIKKRRQQWINENGPCAKCGSWEKLEVDHKDAQAKKLPPAQLWSLALTNPKRIKELAKCWVLCHICHLAKTTEFFEWANGSKNSNTHLTENDVRRIRQLRADGWAYLAIAKLYSVSDSAIGYICRRKTWKHVP